MSMVKFRRHKIELLTVSGTVLEQGTDYETDVYSTGTRVHIQNGHGFVNSPSISSSSTKHIKVWIQTTEGQEVCLEIDNSDMNFREGQSVTAVIAEVKKKGLRYVAAIQNKTTNTSEVTNLSKVQKELKILDLIPSSNAVVLQLILGFLALVVIAGNFRDVSDFVPPTPLILVVLRIIWLMIKSRSNQRHYKKAMLDALNT
ncbi:hypothetical protein [Vibrio agarivorans]|uniref:hypothetical protein n=1 Tax=Vibrio agarivorans TaxID=153622 RepID=UPI0025B2A501|nr:hypothetical protein [Vibrio agarivorans]MDN3661075.1 hypothetical protein [Vibrio agarivorans]